MFTYGPYVDARLVVSAPPAPAPFQTLTHGSQTIARLHGDHTLDEHVFDPIRSSIVKFVRHNRMRLVRGTVSFIDSDATAAARCIDAVRAMLPALDAWSQDCSQAPQYSFTFDWWFAQIPNQSMGKSESGGYASDPLSTQEMNK
jgi:hypothetical protein